MSKNQAPRWHQLTLDTTSQYVEPLSELLSEAGAVAVTYQDAKDYPLYEPSPNSTPLWPDTRIIALFPLEQELDVLCDWLSERYTAQGIIHHLRTETLEEQIWERAWLEHFQPMRFGERLWICPSHYTPPQPEACNILLDPGLAFGTGTHPTTALCLQWLDANPPTDLSVCDFGCGSGVLAIAAAKLGATSVLATDIDPQALQATADNATRNDCLDKITIVTPEAVPEQQFDVVLANILAKPLIQLTQKITSLVKPGGQLVLSGLLENQSDEVLTAYEKCFDFGPRLAFEQWERLNGIKISHIS